MSKADYYRKRHQELKNEPKEESMVTVLIEGAILALGCLVILAAMIMWVPVL